MCWAYEIQTVLRYTGTHSQDEENRCKIIVAPLTFRLRKLTNIGQICTLFSQEFQKRLSKAKRIVVAGNGGIALELV